MMKNKKLIVVFMLIVALLLVMVSFTKASDDVPEIPVIIDTEPTDNNTTEPPSNNGQANNDTNTENTNTNIGNINTNTGNANTNIGNTNTLPQTGVQGDTTLFIFIAICIVSAIYAYFKIRNYKNIN